MSKCSLKVKLQANEAYEKIKNKIGYDLIYNESHKLDNGMEIYIMVFEKYFYRTSNRGTLTISINNFYENTQVNCLAAGTSEGMFFNFDWGARDSFINKVLNLLDDYIIQ